MNARAEKHILSVPPKYRKLYRKVQDGKGSPRLCIKLMCLECIGYSANDVRDCQSTICPLHSKRPFKPAGKAVRGREVVEATSSRVGKGRKAEKAVASA